MSLTLQDLRDRYGRTANVAEFDESPRTESWFGRVTVARPDEEWPRLNGQPLRPILQVKVAELAAPVEGLADLEYLVLYAMFTEKGYLSDTLPGEINEVSGAWCVRSFSSSDQLIEPIAPTDLVPSEFPVQAIRWRQHPDVPAFEDCVRSRAEYPACADDINMVPGIKVGGWPTYVQDRIDWSVGGQAPVSPEYIFQISSDCGLSIGDMGTLYVGRGERGHTPEWAFTFQCC